MRSPLPFSLYHSLAQPRQVAYLRSDGRYLATRQEAGIRLHLYDLWGFWVETWHWTDDGTIGLLRSFTDSHSLEAWLEGVSAWEDKAA